MVEPGPKSRDLETLYRRAEDGDPTAQRDLAVCLHNGDGVSQDWAAAGLWLKKAAEGGDPWAQTQYAINLRSTGEPENQRESVEWLKRAVEQGDHRARCTLGAQQHLGIGTPVDLESALVNLTLASLGGYEDARSMLAPLAALPNINWDAVFERVRWAKLTFIMGPLVDGHLKGLTRNREHDDGTDHAPWLRYETEVAQDLFKPAPGSILDTVFGHAVSVRNVFVGRAIIGGQTLAAVTISMRDIVDSSGYPACFKPPEPALEFLVSVLAPFCARQWVRWSYMSF
jgi:Sel1 repeat